MPGSNISTVQKFINTTSNELVQKFANILDEFVSKSLQGAVRYAWIKSAANQLAYQYLNKPDTTTSNDQIKSVIESLETSNHPLATFIPPNTKQQIIKILKSEDWDKYQEAQLAARQSRRQRQQNPNDSQLTAKKILDQIPDDQKFGVTPQDAEKILKHLRNQPSIINNPTKDSVRAGLQTLTDDSGALKISPVVLNQFSQHLQEEINLDRVHHYVVSTTDALPPKTPFTPFSPTITAKTVSQARSMGVSPLALAYTKLGYEPNDPHLSKDLQVEVSQIKTLLSKPLNPQNRLSLSGYLTSVTLKPQVKLAQKIYHPIYQKLENTKTKINQVTLKPYTTYKTIQNGYQTIKNEKALGWLIAPRERANLTVNNIKLGLKKGFHYQMIKTQKRRRLYQKITKPFNSVNDFWLKWSPGGIRNRSLNWFKRRATNRLISFGDWLIEKGINKTGQNIFKIATNTATAASGVGLFIILAKVAFGFGINLLKRLKEKIKRDKNAFDSAGIGASAIQSILTALKLLSSFIFGNLGGLLGSIVGAIIGFSVFGPVGAMIGFIAGGLLGLGVGSLFGYSLPSIAAGLGAIASGLSSFFTSMIGSASASLAGSLTTIGLTIAIIPTVLIYNQEIKTILAGFMLPETDLNSEKSHFATSCFSFDSSWGSGNSTQKRLENAIDILVEKFPGLVAAACGQRTVTLTHNPEEVSLCSLTRGNQLFFDDYETCYQGGSNSTAADNFAIANFAHELFHLAGDFLNLENVFKSTIGSEPPNSTYGLAEEYWYEDAAESVGNYVLCAITGNCTFLGHNHQQFVINQFGAMTP